MCINCHNPECFGQCLQNIYPHEKTINKELIENKIKEIERALNYIKSILQIDTNQ